MAAMDINDPPTDPVPDDAHAWSSLPSDFARGLLMGTADLVPGVSGGTMALITGIYERLVAAVRFATGILVGIIRFDRARIVDQFRRTEWLLVLPVVAGILAAIVIGSGVLPDLIDEYPVETSSVFFGLILGSLPVPWRMIDQHTIREVSIVAVTAVITFFAVGLPDRELSDPSMIYVFGAAMIAICAMILPGISGSYLLLVFGIYTVTLDAVHDRDLVYIAVFGAGAITGLALFSRVLVRLLTKHHAVTMAALTGLMVGALRALWPWLGDDRSVNMPPSDSGEVLTSLALMAAGAATVMFIVWASSHRKQVASERDVMIDQ